MISKGRISYLPIHVALTLGKDLDEVGIEPRVQSEVKMFCFLFTIVCL